MRSSVGALMPESDEYVVPATCRPVAAKPSIETIAKRFAPEPPTDERDEAPSTKLTSGKSNVSEKGKASPVRAATMILVTAALVPMAILLLLLWQGMISYPHASKTPAPALPEIALSTPDKLEAEVGEETGFVIAVDFHRGSSGEKLDRNQRPAGRRFAVARTALWHDGLELASR